MPIPPLLACLRLQMTLWVALISLFSPTATVLQRSNKLECAMQVMQVWRIA